MRYLVGFGRFWYEFIVGDDWRIAAGVTLVLALGAVVEAAGLAGEWLPPTLAVGLVMVFAAPLIIGNRPPTTGGAAAPAVRIRRASSNETAEEDKMGPTAAGPTSGSATVATTSTSAPATRLGRAVRAVGATSGLPPHLEAHHQVNWLRDVILGGQDGLVNMIGIILGVTAAGGSTSVLIVTGVAAAITESISMGAVGYTSTVSERDYYVAEQARERAEIDTEPEAEREEIRDIYRAKGFSGELLDQVVGTITANRDRWLETMMNEELHLQPVGKSDILRSSVVITIATLIGHLIPLAPFVVLDRSAALVAAIVASGLVLFGVGAYSAITLTGDWRRSGAQMVLIGLGAAFLGYVISSALGAVGG